MVVTSGNKLNTRSGGAQRVWRGQLVALRRCLTLLALFPVQLAVLAMEVLAVFALLCCQFYLWPAAVLNIRWLPQLRRRLAGDFAGVELPTPYRPAPQQPVAGPDGFFRSRNGRRLYTNPRLPLWQSRARWAWADPATWRDLLWLAVDPVIGGLLAVLPPALIGYGLVDVVWPLLPVAGADRLFPLGSGTGGGLGWFAIAVGVGCAVVGWLVAPAAVRLHARWTGLLLAPVSADRWSSPDFRWAGTILGELMDCARFAGLSIGAAMLFILQVVTLACTGPLLGMPAVRHGRSLPATVRCLVFESRGIRIDKPYRPFPATGQPSEVAGGDRPSAVARFGRQWKWLAGDPATWRDLVWLGFQPLVGGVLTLLPPLLVVYGWWGLALPGFEGLAGVSGGLTPWYGSIAGSPLLAVGVGLATIVLVCFLLPVLLTWHGRWAALLLAPTRRAQLLIERDQLTRRVATLTESRSAVVDTQANEVRRIERDLHDGAQARLVAMGMTLGAVEALIDHDPAAAKKLLSQARDASRTALQELRDLVRGIHPPVLAERGLADAIRALALDNPLTVLVNAQLTGRAEAPVESAAYFAVAEALANATKHAQAHRVWIDLRHDAGLLRITVLDDGHGGADASRGSGLRGIDRRLSTFDGRFTLSSPLGGPTMVAMELPCVLSSPRTSTSSGTA